MCEGQPTKNQAKQTHNQVSAIKWIEKVKGQHLLHSLVSIKYYNQQEAKRNDVSVTASVDDLALHMQDMALRLCILLM